MTKTLTVIGDDLGLIIDKSLFEQLRIDKDTSLELETDGESLITTKAEVTATLRRIAGVDAPSR
jgi:antitoxin component of MazEF toxin-antitoxin module